MNRLIIILLASFIIPLLLISSSKTFDTDEAGFIYAGSLELKGIHTYANNIIVMQKPPAIIWVTIPFIAAFGNSFETLIAIRLFCLLIKTLTVLVTYLIAKKLFNNEKIALLSALFLSVSHVANTTAATLMTETFTVFFLSLAFLFYLSEQKHKYIISGIMIGIAAMFRQTAVVFLIIMLLYILIKERNFKLDLKLIMGSIIGALPLIIYIIATNTIQTFIHMTIIFNRYYKYNVFSLSTLDGVFNYEYHMIFFLIAGLVYYVYSYIHKSKKPEKEIYFLIIWIIAYIFLWAVGGWFFQCYLYMILIPIYIIVSKVIYNITPNIWKIKRDYIIMAIVLFVIVLSVTSIEGLKRYENNIDYLIYSQIKQVNHTTMLTDSPAQLFLFNMTEQFYMYNTENVYKEAGLDEMLGERGISNITQYAKIKEFDIIYLNQLIDGKVFIPPGFSGNKIMKIHCKTKTDCYVT
ncbi:MAG: glycosyltransferase family 39 protein [Nanoarchaeota archaeon]